MKTLKIKDICDKGSSTLKQKDVEGKSGKYPVYGASGYISSIDSYHQDKDYIAIVKDGSGIGRVSFMPAYSSVIGTMQYILPKVGYNIKYIAYCLQSLDLSKYKQGAAIPHIYFRDYGERLIKVEENLVEQERIVSLLDLEFAKIDAIKANAEKQFQDAKKIYQNILSDLFVPKDNWDIIKLKDIVNYRRGSFPQPYGKKEWYGGEDAMPFVQVAEMQEDKFDLIYPTNRQISKIAQEYSVFVPKNTVLVSLQGSIGKVAITQYDCYVDRTIAIFMGYKKDVVKEFFAYQIKFKFAIEALNARGTTIKTITKEEFSDFSIRIAPYEEQKIIVKKLDILSERLKQLQSNYEQTITLCSDLKQSILKDIFG